MNDTGAPASEYGDEPRVWVTLHELSGDVASGPFESYEAAKADQDGFDDVYPAQVSRAWFEQRWAALTTESGEAC